MDGFDSRFAGVVVALLALVATGGALDLVLDDPDNWFSLHVMFEVGLVGFSLAAIVYVWREWARARTELLSTRQSLEEQTQEKEAWRRSARVALEGLAQAIQSQFDAWTLTPAEAEVALMVLKGASHAEIAKATHRSEATVRQHAASVYRKSGLSGRAQLAGYFLDDLWLPRSSRAGAEV